MWTAVMIYCALLLVALALGGGHASPLRRKFIVQSSMLSPYEGQTVTLSCVVDGPPLSSADSPSSYEWVKDGRVIPSETGQTLTKESLTGQDDGDYQCGPPRSDVSGEIFHLDVIRGERSPLQETIFYVDKYGSNLLGRTARLRCYFFGPLSVNPSSYVWVKDGKVIPGATERDVHFQSLSSSDTGDYQCADPSMDVPRRNYRLNVITVLPKPLIYDDRPPVSNFPFSLTCLITGGYSVTVDTVYSWYNDSTEIKGQTGQVLWFDNVTEADTGRYTCTARDGPMDTTSHHSDAFELAPLVKPQVRIKPTSPNSLVKGIYGEKLTLTCDVTRANPAVPTNGYSWSFLPSHQGHLKPFEENTKRLTLASPTQSDSGQYICQARNDQKYGTITMVGHASVTLDIVYLDNISLMVEKVVIKENDRVVFTCKVDSHPKAHLVWTINGEDVRHVIDNLDHYVISKAACADSTIYTCRATNLDVPDREITATSQLLVNCSQGNGTRAQRPGSIMVDVAAPFDITLPKKMSVVVVHPNGQDLITVHPNCSYNVSSAFQSRCLEPECNIYNHHLTFTLTQVTDRDEGNYSCMEEIERRPIPHCSQMLILKMSDITHQGTQVWWISSFIAGIVLGTLGVVQIIVHREKIPKIPILIQRSCNTGVFSITFWRQLMTRTQGDQGSHKFETLYEKGKVYIFPTLVQPKQQALADNDGEANESSPMLEQTEEEIEFTVKNLLRYTLQALIDRDGLPSFLLHNTCLSWKENIILILSRKLGIVLMTIKPFHDLQDKSSIQNAASHLMETKTAIAEKLRGLVNPSMITAAICSPRVLTADVNLLKKRFKNIEVLPGLELAQFQQLADKLSRRPDSDVWNLINADYAYKMAASRFLTLADGCGATTSFRCPTAAKTWLLTQSQMEVRDSTAKLLHVWGAPGSGKSTLLIHRSRRWLAEGKAVVIAVGKAVHDVLFAHVVKETLREQKQETRKKIRICHISSKLGLTLTELGDLYPDTEVCLVIDALRDAELLRETVKAIRSKQVSTVWSVCRKSLQTLDYELSMEAHELGWESFKLPESLSCTNATVELMNRLEMGSPSYYHITALSVPRAQNVPGWRVVDHCLHPNHLNTTFDCGHCKSELSDTDGSQDQLLPWSDCIALFTGNPNAFTDIKPIYEALRRYEIPATLDKHYEKIAGHGSHLDSPKTDVFQWHERVVAGVDETGEATVHLVRVRDSIGIWKERVLMVHWDKRDNDLKCQSDEDRKTRLAEHRYLWFLAASRCKGQVILLLLTPSPARSLLDLPEAVMPTSEA